MYTKDRISAGTNEKVTN